MDTNNIKALAQILHEYGLTALETGEGAGHIRLERTPLSPAPPPAPVPPAAAMGTPAALLPDDSIDYNRLTEVTSPMVGVFYAASAPDADAFVHMGSRVRQGDVLCIIEAMKLMNEIVAEQEGEVVDICVRNGDIVEFGQVLFKIF